MPNRTTPPSSARPASRRWGRAQLDNRDDAYLPGRKPAEPTVCPQCGAVYHRGRWQWAAAPEGAHSLLCEACHRIKENYPAGIVTLEGAAVEAHGDEIARLMRHREEAEKSRHPLNRIMSIERPSGTAMSVQTTDIHLPRRLVRAVQKAYGGRATEHFEEDGDFVRIAWRES